MNKNIALVLSCAVSILALVSCNNKETDLLKSKDKTHTVVFKAQTPAAAETKTSLRLEVVPDWRNTDVNDVHIFETETTSSGKVYRTEANLVKMETPINNDWSIARFSAAFDNAEAIVVPPTKAETTPGFKYTAIMASTLVEGEVVKYVVPSVQYPDEDAWIDPKADMLIGCDGTTYSNFLTEDQEIGLSFKRPVALARLAITNLEGTTVSKVKMTTANHITGYVTYDEINFDERKIEAFDGDDSNKELTILYPEGKKKTTTFYAYFVCVPGTIQFSKIEVYTDEYVFTKTYATPASLTFTAGDFKNIALDMTPKDNNGVTRTGLGQQTLKFVDANQQEVTEPIKFDLVNGKDKFAAPTLVIGDDVVDKTKVTVTSNNEEVATVDAGVVSLVGATGEATITASVPGDDTHAAGYASYKIIVTDTTAPATVTFYKAEELVAGQEYIIVSGGQAMTLDGTTLGVTAVTDVDGVIETDKDVALWTAAEHVEYYEGTSPAGHYTLKSGDNYLQRHSDNSTQTGAAGEVPSTKKYYVWEYDGTHLYHHSSSSNTFYLGYNDNVWKFNYQSPYYTTTLYSTTKPRTKQVITFGEEPVTAKYDLNGGQWTVAVPTLDGAKTTVTYESSDTAVATVDATSGDVTIAASAKKGDKATITATAAQSDEYTSATASYTIEIIDSTPGATAVYNKVTSVDELEEDGQYLLVYEGNSSASDDKNKTPKVFNPVLTSDGSQFDKATTSALDVTIASGVIESSDFEDCQFTLEKGYYLKANKAAKYIYPGSSGSSSVMLAEATASHALTITFNAGIAEIKNGSRYLVWSTSSGYFSCNSSVSGQYSTGICLYKMDEGLTEQTLSFSGNEAVYDLGTSEWTTAVPTLSGAQTSPLVWESSDKTVATVDESGNITPVAKGTTTIKVTAPKSDTYKKGTASFTVTVTNSSAPVYTYTQITAKSQLVSGATYLIVSADANNYNGLDHKKAFVGDADGNAADVNAANGVISGDYSDNEFVITASGENYTLYGPNGYVTGNENAGSRYIQVGTTAGTMSLNMKADLSDALVNDAFYFYYTKSGSKEVLYMNADEKFKIGGSGRKYGVYLYMKEGSEPEPPTTSTYTRIAGSAELVSGTYIIANKTDAYLFNASGSNNGGYATIGTTTGVTRSETTITLTDDIAAAYEFVFTVDGENLTIKQVGGTHAGQYMFASASVSNTYIGFQATEKNFKINSQEGNLVYFGTQKGSNDYSEYLYKKSTDSFFKLGGSGSPTASDPKDAGVFLYKKN